jgi:hypothetical protein
MRVSLGRNPPDVERLTLYYRSDLPGDCEQVVWSSFPSVAGNTVATERYRSPTSRRSDASWPVGDGEVINTGLRKFGAILGDRVQIGCNAVLNPGTVMGPGSMIYPNATVAKGIYPAATMIKVRQAQEVTEVIRPE